MDYAIRLYKTLYKWQDIFAILLLQKLNKYFFVGTLKYLLWPNFLTLIRLFLLIFILPSFFYLKIDDRLFNCLLLFGGLDYLDGKSARAFGTEGKTGEFIDQFFDKLCTIPWEIFIIITLGWQYTLVAIFSIGIDLSLLVFRFKKRKANKEASVGSNEIGRLKFLVKFCVLFVITFFQIKAILIVCFPIYCATVLLAIGSLWKQINDFKKS